MILDVIETHPEVREPLLRVLLTERLLALPEQVDKLQSDFEEFRDETRTRFDGIDQRLTVSTNGWTVSTNASTVSTNGWTKIPARFAGWKATSGDWWARLTKTCAAPKSPESSMGNLTNRCWLIGNRSTNGFLAERHANRISRDEYLDGLRPDIIARSKNDDTQAGPYAVIEASVTFNQTDLRNAARRAEVISRVMGVATEGFVVTNSDWPTVIDELAEQLGVTIIRHLSPDHDET